MATMMTRMVMKGFTSPNPSTSNKMDVRSTASNDTNSVVSTDVSDSEWSMDVTPMKDGNPILKMLYCFDQTPTSTLKEEGVPSTLKKELKEECNEGVPSTLKEECEEECKEEWIELKSKEVQPTILFEEKEEDVKAEVKAEEEVESVVVKERELKVDRVVLAFEVALLMAIVLYIAYPYLKETPAGEYLSSKGAEAAAMIASTPFFDWLQGTYTQLMSSVHDKTSTSTVWLMGVSETTFERLEQMYPGSRNYISGFLMHFHLDWIVVKPTPPSVKATHKIWRFLRALLHPKARPQAPVNKKPGKFIKWVKSALAGPVAEDFESYQVVFPK